MQLYLLTFVAALGLVGSSLMAAEREGANEVPARYHVSLFLATPAEALDAKADTLIEQKYDLLRVRNPEQPPADRPAVAYVHRTAEEYGRVSERMVQLKGRQLDDAQTKALLGAKAVWLLDVITPREQAASTLRQVERLMLDLAEQTGGILYDGETREYFSPGGWKQLRIDSWQDDLPMMSRQTTIHLYPANNSPLLRAITLGMGKFGLPDVLVEEVSRSEARSVVSLMVLAQQTLFERGERPQAEGTLAVDIGAIKHTGQREWLQKGLLEGATGRGSLAYVRGKREEGDPQNDLLLLTFAGFDGKTILERRNAAIARILGSRDSVTALNHDQEVLAASARAKAKLPALRERFAAGLDLGERLMIKGPFKTPEGGSEWMWIEVTGWQGEKIEGILQNDPVAVKNLRAGARVDLNQADVFDYLLIRGDGTMEGNETAKFAK